ncbi:uncharacterized protein LOC126593559 [Malus sylvestris]|uniref:uncharacterized protein LOC126593559 n=1 Tax=Malus sylvestris TaxID=3752 RepID=UPI0021AC5381|nr:uncharacterized protein LOC126593559 [Malus sylvestris]
MVLVLLSKVPLLRLKQEKIMIFDDMVALLLSTECRMEDHNTSFHPDHTTVALFAPSGFSPNHGRGTTLHLSNGRTSSFSCGGFQGRGSFHGRGAGNPFVSRCSGSNGDLFHGGSGCGLFQSRGILPTPAAVFPHFSYLPNHVTVASSSFGYRNIGSSSNGCNYCGDHRHSTANCFKSPFSEGRYLSPQSHAMMASPMGNDQSPTWFVEVSLQDRGFRWTTNLFICVASAFRSPISCNF